MIDIKFLEHEILDQYLMSDNNRPWIIGFSGGKDSTMLLQLVWNTVKKLPHSHRNLREIHIVCNNTLVENPKILKFTEKTLQSIEKASLLQGLNITVNRTTPKIEETFWLNLIGKGYRSPDTNFRWCTERLKINPTTQFILNQIDKNGEVIILLGTRSDESRNRANSIKKHEIFGQRLRKHILPNAYVYAPLKDITTDEVWQYLLQNPAPWGGHHRELITLYRNASGGDCPLVIDTTTPSCGNSRFGCWTCTVVNKDKSMQGLIDNGEEWMQPLLDLREYLAESMFNMDMRQQVRRNGQEGPGPYKPHIRAEILRRLLNAQKSIQEEGEAVQLITYQELIAIQIVWYRDGIINQNVSGIYHTVYHENSETMEKTQEKMLEEQALLNEVCKDSPKDVELIETLLGILKSKSLMLNSRGVPEEFEEHIEKFIKNS